jgi:DNA-directed RNA polymerase specialized sigma24 family protein
MSPNNSVPEDEQKRMQDLAKRFSIGYAAKETGYSVNTVKKYIREGRELTNDHGG